MEHEPTNIHLDKKIAQIIPTAWDYSFNPDNIFEINPFNIVGELITIPVLVSRLGILVAEMASFVKKERARLKFKEAEIAKLYRNKESGEGRKKPTVNEMDEHLTLDPVLNNLRLKLIRHEEELQKLEVFHEASQKKSFNIGILGRGLVPKEFEKELVEETINGVMIRMRDKQYSK